MDRARLKQAAASAMAWTQRGKIKRVFLTIGAVLMVMGAASFSWSCCAPCWRGRCGPVGEPVEYHAEGSTLYDIAGQPIGTLATVNRRIVPLDSLPPHLPQAFVAIED